MDPLRSFAELLGSMWRARRGESTPADRTATAPVASPAARAPSARTEESLRSRLRSRIADVGTQDPRRVRDAFVESVLGWELGDELARDPGFSEIVRLVSDHIEGEPRLRARLHELLVDLVREQPRA